MAEGDYEPDYAPEEYSDPGAGGVTPAGTSTPEATSIPKVPGRIRLRIRKGRC